VERRAQPRLAHGAPADGFRQHDGVEAVGGIAIAASLVLAEILHEAEFPAGVFNVITQAPGAAGPVADAMFESPAVRSINFTGSSATGRMLAERAGKNLKRIVLELGGYNPLIVLRDVDMKQAIDTTAFGAFFHQGQICMNTRKVFVERPIAQEYIEKLVAKTESIKIGDLKVPSTVIGSLINDRALEMVRDHALPKPCRRARAS
jgi:acyl-CoA reductase-like NAD-dependent aldehyde dehydrogenase